MLERISTRWVLFCGLVALGGGCGDDSPATDDLATDGGSGGAQGSTDEPDDPGSTGEVALDRIPVVCPDSDPDPTISEHTGTLEGGEWSDGVHVVSGRLRVTGHLEVGPCVAVVMRDEATLLATDGGSIALVGEPERPVLVTSASAQPRPGDWSRIEFAETSVGPNNRIEHAIVEYGGHGQTPGMVLIDDGAEASIVESILTGSETYGFVIAGAASEFSNNDVSGNFTAGWIRPDQVGALGRGTYGPSVEGGIVVAEGWVRHDQTWLAHDAPYVIESALGVGTGQGSAHLTIEAGAQLRIASEGWIEVDENGGLTMAGTETEPVVVQSAKSVGAAGDWRGVRFEADSVDAFNELEWVVIEHAGWDGAPAVEIEEGAAAGLRHCTLRNNARTAVFIDNGADVSEFRDNIVTDNGVGVRVSPNVVGRLESGVYGPNDADGIVVLEGWVRRDATWRRHDVPYVINDGISIGSSSGSAGVTVEAGAQIGLLDSSINVKSGGWLTLDGTETDPVIVTSSKAQPAPADWQQIRFEDGSVTANNLLRHARIEYGGGGVRDGMVLLDGGYVALDHVEFGDSAGDCDIGLTYWGDFGDVSALDTTYVPCE